MRRSWLRRRLGEMSQAAVGTSVGEHTDPGGTRAELAMLIDTENVTPTCLDDVMRRAGKYARAPRAGGGCALATMPRLRLSSVSAPGFVMGCTSPSAAAGSIRGGYNPIP